MWKVESTWEGLQRLMCVLHLFCSDVQISHVCLKLQCCFFCPEAVGLPPTFTQLTQDRSNHCSFTHPSIYAQGNGALLFWSFTQELGTFCQCRKPWLADWLIGSVDGFSRGKLAVILMRRKRPMNWTIPLKISVICRTLPVLINCYCTRRERSFSPSDRLNSPTSNHQLTISWLTNTNHNHPWLKTVLNEGQFPCHPFLLLISCQSTPPHPSSAFLSLNYYLLIITRVYIFY